MNLKNFFKTQQQTIIQAVAALLLVIIAFGLGRITAYEYQPPEIRVEEVFSPLNNTENLPETQLPPPTPTVTPAAGDCPGKIKGNISSGGEKIYHMPGGSFYNRTIAEVCFETEAAAVAAGFRKSSR